MARVTQFLPVRMMIDVYRVRPSRSKIVDEPLLRFQGVADLSPDLKQKELPIWFDAEVQVRKDGTFDLLTFEPTYGSVDNYLNKRLFEIYKFALRRAIKLNMKNLLGVS